MALVKAKRDELLGPLSSVSGIIERRHTLPILSNVLIDSVCRRSIMPLTADKGPSNSSRLALTKAIIYP